MKFNFVLDNQVITNKINLYLDSFFNEKYNINLRLALVIYILAEENEKTHSEISSILTINKSTTTRLIKDLEKKLLITKNCKKKDLRIESISLTSHGKELGIEITNDFNMINTTILAGFKDNEINKLDYILKNISSNLRKFD